MKKVAHIKFQILSLDEQIDIIQNFLLNDNEMQPPILQNLEIEQTFFQRLSLTDKQQYIKRIVTERYQSLYFTMSQKICEFQKLWNKNEKFINNEFEKIFAQKFDGIKEYNAYLSINPVCPRFLKNQSFHVFVNSEPEFLLTTCIHELLHFYWFDRFGELFPNVPQTNFEFPYPEWEFSEIAVDPLVTFSGLKKFFVKYRPAYERFYSPNKDGVSQIEIIRNLYQENSLDDFMKKGLDYIKSCLNTEQLNCNILSQ